MTIHPREPAAYRFECNVRRDDGARLCGGRRALSDCGVCAGDDRPPLVHVWPPAGLRGRPELRDRYVAAYVRRGDEGAAA